MGLEGGEQLHSIEELSNILRIPIKTIYKWTSDSRSGIPFFKVGRHLRFRYSDVERWLIKYRGSEGAKEFCQGIGKEKR